MKKSIDEIAKQGQSGGQQQPRCCDENEDEDHVVIVTSSTSSCNDESSADSTPVNIDSKQGQPHQYHLEKSNKRRNVDAALTDNSKVHGDSDEENEEAYRLRVYGTTEKYGKRSQLLVSQQSSLRRLSRQFSNALLRRQSSIVESLPETPAGWAVLFSAMASAALGYEIQLQKSLTCPPLVYGQCCCEKNRLLVDIYKRLTATPDCILRRDIQPSLFVGTRAVISSTAGYLLQGPGASDQHVRFRQVLTMAQDGAELALDWELPILKENEKISVERRQREILNGPIQQPVVLILHGMNNDSSFGYVKRMMRTCTNRGWIAVCMNFRGCGGVPMSTPRGYSGSYTGDLRHVVQHVCSRLSFLSNLFIVGHSLSANIVCKYLGEEGLSGTLPKQVAGSVLLSNPMFLGIVDPISSVVLALGVKKTVLESWSSIRKFKDAHYQSRIRKAILSPSILDFDNAMAPIFIRNESVYPFAFRIGYENGQEYYHDASSYRHIRHITVPTLQLIARDDFLVYPSFKTKSYFSLANPNVMVVETKCGGHLGWQESAPPSSPQAEGYDDIIGGRQVGSMVSSSSWSDVATADFIQAVIETLQEQDSKRPLPDRDKQDNSRRMHNFSSPSSLNASHADSGRFIEQPPASPPFQLHSRL